MADRPRASEGVSSMPTDFSSFATSSQRQLRCFRKRQDAALSHSVSPAQAGGSVPFFLSTMLITPSPRQRGCFFLGAQPFVLSQIFSALAGCFPHSALRNVSQSIFLAPAGVFLSVRTSFAAALNIPGASCGVSKPDYLIEREKSFSRVSGVFLICSCLLADIQHLSHAKSGVSWPCRAI